MRSAETQFRVQARPAPQPGPHPKPQPGLPALPLRSRGKCTPPRTGVHRTRAYRLLRTQLEQEAPRELDVSPARANHEGGSGRARCTAHAGPVCADPALCTCTSIHPPKPQNKALQEAVSSSDRKQQEQSSCLGAQQHAPSFTEKVWLPRKLQSQPADSDAAGPGCRCGRPASADCVRTGIICGPPEEQDSVTVLT